MIEDNALGRVPSEPGSRASTEPVPVSAASGFDPSRGLTVHGLQLPAEALSEALSVLSVPHFRLEDVRGRISRALHDREFDFGIQHKGSVLDRAADRYLQRMKKAGLVRYVGGKVWAPQ